MKTIASIISIALLLIGCSDGKKVAQTANPILPVLEISSNTATTYTEFPAAIQGTVDVEIRPQVNGTLEKVFVDEGAYVTKGQSLFKIDENPYREQVNNALASLNASEAASLNAQLEVDKLTPLVLNKVVSDIQLKTAETSLKVAKANVAQAKALLGSAKINLGYTLIKAPVSGYIGRLPKKQGSQIGLTDAEALTTLSDVKEVFAYFSMGENDFIQFKSQYEGNTINDKLKALPPVSLILADNSTYIEKGKIDMVNGQFDKNTGAITLRATFPNPKGLLRSGNTGIVKLSIAHQNAVLIPQEATMEIQDKVFVFVVDKNNKVSKTAIVVSGTSGTDYLVKEGVKSGDRVVLKGFESLKEGVVINPEKAKSTIAKL